MNHFLIFLLVFISTPILTIVASESASTWVIPVIRPYTMVAGGGYEYRPEVSLGDGGRYELNIARASLRSQVWNNETNELVLSGSWQDARFNSDAVFSSVGDFPEHLHDLRLGGLYRHVTPEKTVLGIFFAIGTADEQPYSSSAGTGVNATAFWRHPLARDALLFTLTYIDNAAILGGVPLPGITYEWHPDTATTVLLGVPFTLVTWRSSQRTSLNASLSVFGTARVSTSFTPWEDTAWLQLQTGLEYGAESAKWTEHLPKDERVYARAGKVSGGVSCRFGPLNTGTLIGGWLFARKVGIGDSLFDLDDYIRPNPGPFVAVNLSSGF